MKKIIFTLLALVGTMSMNAQIVKPGVEIMKNGVVVATYTADQADEVVFKEVTIPTTGTAQRTGGIDVNWVQLWDGGPKFAEYNVGVTDGKAESYGGYYCWGNTAEQSSNWTGQAGTDDIATELWGSNWRMPTDDELQELLANCTPTIVDDPINDGKILGIKYTGKDDYASNSVFLPAAGYCTDGNVSGQGDDGYYWSSTPDGSYYAYYLYFLSGYQYVDDFNRLFGYSVRAVLAK